jgi:O-antigen/teichoic acid export membrane protein
LLQRFWAAFERIIPRGVVALATVSAAAVTDPHSLGLYSWAILALSLYGAITDLPVRHIAVAHVGSSVGETFLRRYALVSGSIGLLSMTAACWMVANLFGHDDSVTRSFLSLVPLALVPPAQAFSTQPTAVLQRDGLWAEVSGCRTIASIFGAGIGVPLVFVTHSIVGASLAIMTSEVAYTALVWFFARRKANAQNVGTTTDRIGYWSTWAHMSVYSVLGWLQSQSERGFLGLWAGTSALGTYSLGTAIGRSAGDAIAASQASILRVDLSTKAAYSDLEIRTVVGRNLRTVTPIAAVSAVVVIAVTKFVLAPLLGLEWASALAMVPILALTGIPLAVAASSAPVHIQRGRANVAYLAPALCLLFAPFVGIAATNSLTLAAWVVLARECVLALTQSVVMGKATPWREVAVAALTVSLGALAVTALGT